MLFEKDKYTFIFKWQFCNLPEIWFQSFKISFKFTFHGVFPSHKTTFLKVTDTRGSVKFYRNTSQILWLLPFAHLGDKLWPVTKVSKDLA